MDRVAAEDLPTTDTDVLVVGAGPTGLMAGLVLARRGVPAVVVDRKAGPTRESRALAVQARTMEVYDQLGLADEVVAGSYRATRIQVGPGGELLGFGFEQAQRGATRYPGLHVFEQSRNEELLSAALAGPAGRALAAPAARPGRGGRRRRDGDVVAVLEGPDGLTRVRARWCVGADGATSVVRRLLDVPFEGVTDDATFWVADLRGVQGLPDRALAARLGRRTFGVMFPLGPGGHARLISMAERRPRGRRCRPRHRPGRPRAALRRARLVLHLPRPPPRRGTVPQGLDLPRRRRGPRALARSAGRA